MYFFNDGHHPILDNLRKHIEGLPLHTEKCSPTDKALNVSANAQGLPEPPRFPTIQFPWLNDPPLSELIHKKAAKITHKIDEIFNEINSEKIPSTVKILRDLWRYSDNENQRKIKSLLYRALEKNTEYGVVPKEAYSVWFNDKKNIGARMVGNKFPSPFRSNIVNFIALNPDYKYTIYTDDVNSTRTVLRKGFTKESSLLKKIDVVSWREPFESSWGNLNYLKPILETAIESEKTTYSRVRNVYTASDIMRFVVPMRGKGGIYFDLDTQHDKSLPKKIVAPFGILVGTYGSYGGGCSLEESQGIENQVWGFPDRDFPCRILEEIGRLYNGAAGQTFHRAKSGDKGWNTGYPPESMQQNPRIWGTSQVGGTPFRLLRQIYGLPLKNYGGYQDKTKKVPSLLILGSEGGYFKVPSTEAQWGKPPRSLLEARGLSAQSSSKRSSYLNVSSFTR